MHTNIHTDLLGSAKVSEAEDIIRACVHCGFCNAVCPTYQLLGDELDGPRGRIYQIKNLLEDNEMSAESRLHLDRCLSCRSCETTCPSGVRYGRLLDIARELVTKKRPQAFLQGAKSWLLRALVPRAKLFGFLLRLGQVFKGLMPSFLARHIPAKAEVLDFASASALGHESLDENAQRETVLLLQGCVQQAATPNVNQSIAHLLSKNNVAVRYLADEGCCGALDYHLSAHDEAIRKIRSQVEKLHQELTKVDWILSSASGCGVTIKEYPEILKYETDIKESNIYETNIVDKAQAVANKVLDIGEYLAKFSFRCDGVKVAIHTPCSLQHGQKLPDLLESILLASGANIVPVAEKHLCCGSAGTYSIMQPKISAELTSRKVAALMINQPEVIVSANVGCQLSLQENSDVKVMHWVEFLAAASLHHEQ